MKQKQRGKRRKNLIRDFWWFEKCFKSNHESENTVCPRIERAADKLDNDEGEFKNEVRKNNSSKRVQGQLVFAIENFSQTKIFSSFARRIPPLRFKYFKWNCEFCKVKAPFSANGVNYVAIVGDKVL